MGVRRILAVLAAVFLMAGGAAAEPSKFEEPIKYRRAAMVMIKWNVDRLSPMVRNPQAFNRDEAVRTAANIEFLSRNSLEGFVPGSFEGETKALPEIWKDWNRFKTLNDRFQAEAAKLRDIAKTGDPAAVKAQLGETNKVCKNCHDDFKSSRLLP